MFHITSGRVIHYYFISLHSNSKTYSTKKQIIKINKCGDGKTEEELFFANILIIISSYNSLPMIVN